MSENIEIKITDNISSEPRRKIERIAEAALKAGDAVERLKNQLKSINVTAFNKLENAVTKQALASDKLKLSQQKLRTETERTVAAQFKAESAFNQAAIAENRAATSANNLAKSQFDASLTAEKFATQQLRTKEGVLGLAIAEEKLVNTQVKTALSAEKLTLASQRSATELQKTSLVKSQASLTNQKEALTEQKLYTEMRKTAGVAIKQSGDLLKNTGIKIKNTAGTLKNAMAEQKLARGMEKVALATKKSTFNIIGFLSKAALIAGVVGTTTAVLVKSADSYTVLQNKLKNVTETSAQLAAVTNEVFKIAKSTRSPVADTAKAFQRFDLAVKGLGGSQRESLNLTETINKALVLSGATANETGAALLQLSQAFNKGKLDGDEFRTVMELMPTAADAIAKELKTTRGELLKLAPQGKITSAVMLRAFKAASEGINKKFGETTKTLGQGLTAIANGAIKAFGEFNKATGATENLAKGLIEIGNVLGDAVTWFKALKNVTVGLFENILGKGTFVATFNKILSTAKNGIEVFFTGAVSFIKGHINLIIGWHVFLFNVIVRLFGSLGNTIASAFVSAANFVISSITSLANSVLDALKWVDRLQAKITGVSLVNKDLLFTSLPLGEAGEAGENVGKIFSEEFENAINTDFLGDLFSSVGGFFKDVDAEAKKLRGGTGSDKDLRGSYAASNYMGGGGGGASPVVDLEKNKADAAEFFDAWNLVLPELSTLFTDTFKGITDGYSDAIGHQIVFMEKMSDFKDILNDVWKNALANLISGLIKLGVQYVVLQATSAAAGAASTAAGVAQAATLATAYAPAATLASLASFGGNAVPAAAGMTATASLGELIAASGFKAGGFTGNGGRSDVAGVVHYEEFVNNAESTSRNRVALEAANNGAKLMVAPYENSNQNSSQNSGETKVINNYISDLFTGRELAMKYAKIEKIKKQKNIRAKV